ncbi:LrgB family protein [Pseudodesulfovibrio sp.]|uniref:LrgB family protein n=1 Tax=Pseudodesulfovibrio sp. TaxID=2035812 RepID=UPI002628C174|nr:LrgB family protein [Pseudodesulfovibrio sp.]MDD3311235.1 LrgB family protein [Pseudodesulfovibrio sp.]
MSGSAAVMSGGAAAVFWIGATYFLFVVSRAMHRRMGAWWSSPLLMTCGSCLALALCLHASYGDYMRGGQWLLMLLGPATVAFALPIHEHRALIRKHWQTLLVGLACGSLLAFGGTWLVSGWLGLSDGLRLAILPRSFTTPFAMAFASDVGGSPDLAAVCVILTGVFGASIGGVLLRILPLRSSFARGMMFGMGAHGAGVARAREVGAEEEAVAGLVMVLAGVGCALIGLAVSLLK